MDDKTNKIVHDIKRVARVMSDLVEEVGDFTEGAVKIRESIAVMKVQLDRLWEDIANNEGKK